MDIDRRLRTGRRLDARRISRESDAVWRRLRRAHRDESRIARQVHDRLRGARSPEEFRARMKEMRWERKGEKDHWRHPERRVQVRLEAKGNARSSGQAYYRVELSRSPKFTKDQKDVVAKFDRRGRPQPRGPKDVPLGRFMDLPVAQKMRQVDGNMSRTHEPLPRMPADARGRARAKAVLAELSGRADRRQEVSKAWAGRAETLREAARKRRAAREQGREKGSRGKSR